MERRRSAAVLQVVVTADCIGCAEAAWLVALVRRELPQVGVELHILAGAGPTVPGIAATPAYLLDGRPIFLGNPHPEALLAVLRRS
jgi:hypothetical protein